MLYWPVYPWGFQAGMWLPGPGFNHRRKQHVSTDFNTVSSWPVFRMRRWNRGPLCLYRTSQRSHGTLMEFRRSVSGSLRGAISSPHHTSHLSRFWLDKPDAPLRESASLQPTVQTVRRSIGRKSWELFRWWYQTATSALDWVTIFTSKGLSSFR